MGGCYCGSFLNLDSLLTEINYNRILMVARCLNQKELFDTLRACSKASAHRSCAVACILFILISFSLLLDTKNVR